jgi:RNA polymerase sigma-70 factor, ECF subfamily
MVETTGLIETVSAIFLVRVSRERPSNGRGPAPKEGWEWQGTRQRCLHEALRVLRNPHDAEEAAQEALLRAWRYRHSCRERGAWPGWVRRIARNEALRVAAERARVATAELPQGLEFDPETEGDEQALALAALSLRGILRLFEEDEQRLLRMRYYDDLTQIQIAERLGVPEGTVKVRLHRLRNRVRKLIEEGRA